MKQTVAQLRQFDRGAEHRGEFGLNRNSFSGMLIDISDVVQLVSLIIKVAMMGIGQFVPERQLGFDKRRRFR